MGRGYVKQRPERAADAATEAQVDAMNAKLAARAARVTPPPAQRSDAAQSPQAKSEVKLEWKRVRVDAMRTTCGRYSCCKVTVKGKTTYELWKLIPGGEWFRPIHIGIESFEKAQQLAHEDVNS